MLCVCLATTYIDASVYRVDASTRCLLKTTSCPPGIQIDTSEVYSGTDLYVQLLKEGVLAFLCIFSMQLLRDIPFCFLSPIKKVNLVMSAKSPANGDINPSPVKRSKRNADHPTGPRKVAIKSTSLSSNENAHARRHRKLIDQLTACGIQKYIPIPKITVLGSQSAGKSSILEVNCTVFFL